MKRLVVIAALSILAEGCASSGGVFPPYAPRLIEGGSAPTSTLDRLFGDIAEARGMPALSSVVLSEGTREIRIWEPYGMVAQARRPMLRVVRTPDGVSGEFVVHWAQPDTASVAEGSRCVPFREALLRCVAIAETQGIDWDDVAADLDSLGAWTLRERCADDLVSVQDAGDLYVQRLEGARFDEYRCNAPGRRVTTDAGRRALALWNYLWSWLRTPTPR